MEKSPNLSKALLYTSIWPDKGAEPTLEAQSVELQSFCLMNELNPVEILSDIGPGQIGMLRVGLDLLLQKANENEIQHIVITDISRIAQTSESALAFLNHVMSLKNLTLHICAWNANTKSFEQTNLISILEDVIQIDSVKIPEIKAFSPEKFRIKPLWIKLFGMLQDERYAEELIQSLFHLGDRVQLSELESMAVHGGYDHLNLFRALGFRIKGEKTENTKRVADVLVRYWDHLKIHLGAEVHRLIENSETSAFL